jgi:transforming growth factor-beta-induced protein
MKQVISVLLMVLMASSLFAIGTIEYNDPIDTAEEAGSFTTLLAALDAAGLTDVLRGEGPFTVLAPTDDAFAALPDGLVEALLSDIPTLTEILLYHVVPADVRANQVVSLDSAPTVQGETIAVDVRGGNVYMNQAQVIATDIDTTNGVIHVLDQVIVPPSINVARLLADDDIVDIAIADGRFTTLVAAVQAAGLVDTLKSEGPFTVFAPTDDAFAKLPAGTVASLLRNIPTLRDILLYHVIGDEVLANEVVELSSATTVQGQPVVISTDGGVFVNDAQVIIPDVQAANGVIHVIDTVILPPSGNIAEVLTEDGRFSTLLAAVEAADLVETLSGEGPFTLFAPTDAAFRRLPVGTVPALLGDIPQLTDILLYHVVSGRVFSGDVVGLSSAASVQGEDIQIAISGGNVLLNGDSTVTEVDMLANNGVIHVIDRVILPSGDM